MKANNPTQHVQYQSCSEEYNQLMERGQWRPCHIKIALAKGVLAVRNYSYMALPIVANPLYYQDSGHCTKTVILTFMFSIGSMLYDIGID